MSAPDPFVLEYRECACFRFRRMARLVTAAYDRELRSTGLRATQISILAHVAAGISDTTVLEDWLALERTSLLRALKALQRMGWVEAMPTGTGAKPRSIGYAITPDGLELLRKIHPEWRTAQSRVTESFGKSVWPEMTAAFDRSGQALSRTA